MLISVIAGGAGFVGSNLLPLLAVEDRHLVILDNLSRGSRDYISSIELLYPEKIHFFPIDVANLKSVLNVFEEVQKYGKIDEVWHFAANSDILAGVTDPGIDLQDTFMSTFSLLQAMKKFEIKSIHFASSSAIYGDLGATILHESIGPLLPISNYGAMKLASEALISAATESHLSRANLFRFPNVVGTPATHGVILDFIGKLRVNKKILNVLGDGTQQKSYLHVSDLVAAMMHIRSCNDLPKIYPVNIGPIDGGVTVRFIAESVAQRISPQATINYGLGNKGWLGDVPRFNYSVDRLLHTGWMPSRNSADAVLLAIEQIAYQEGFE